MRNTFDILNSLFFPDNHQPDTKSTTNTQTLLWDLDHFRELLGLTPRPRIPTLTSWLSLNSANREEVVKRTEEAFLEVLYAANSCPKMNTLRWFLTSLAAILWTLSVVRFRRRCLNRRTRSFFHDKTKLRIR